MAGRIQKRRSALPAEPNVRRHPVTAKGSMSSEVDLLPGVHVSQCHS